jgi:hypothetical protein
MAKRRRSTRTKMIKVVRLPALVGAIKEMANLFSMSQSEVPKRSMDHKPNAIDRRRSQQLFRTTPDVRIPGLSNIGVKTFRVEGEQSNPSSLLDVHKRRANSPHVYP